MRPTRLASLRAGCLAAILVAVALVSLHQSWYSRLWVRPLEATVFPLNADGRAETAAYIASLADADFDAIERWATREAARHELLLEHPLKVTLGDTVDTLPPPWPGEEPTPLAVLIWGLRLRWWAFRHTPRDDGDLVRVRLFVLYHTADDDRGLPHSLGLEKGLIGLVHAYADPDQNAQNRIVIAHELLHTVGATDKYGAGGQPLFPVGYANPYRRPLFPQRSAEIMAARIPTSRYSAYMAESLRSVMVSELTASEIGWYAKRP